MTTSLENAGLSSGNGVIRLLFKYVSNSLTEMILKIDEAKRNRRILDDDIQPNSISSSIAKPTSNVKSHEVEDNIIPHDNENKRYEQVTSVLSDSKSIEYTTDGLPDCQSQVDRQVTVFRPVPENYTMPKCKHYPTNRKLSCRILFLSFHLLNLNMSCLQWKCAQCKRQIQALKPRP